MNDSQFDEILQRVGQECKTEATATQYTRKIKDFREWLDKPFEQADAIDVEDWLAELDDHYTNASSVSKGSAALVKAYSQLNKLIEAERINAEGWVGDTPPERASYTPDDTSTHQTRKTHEDLIWLEPEEVDELAQATERLRDELIVRLLFQTGCRVTELCEIRLEDVNRDKRLITVRGKGRKNRPVGYQPDLDFLMDVWLEERRPAIFKADESEYLFPTSHSEHIRREAVARNVREAAEAAGLQDVYGESSDGVPLHNITPHTLRHSFAMAAKDKGWDIHTLSTAMGHESVEITADIYLHKDDRQIMEAYQRRGPSSATGSA